MSDLIDRHEAIRDIRLMDVCVMYDDACSTEEAVEKAIVATKRNAIFGLECMHSAEPEIIRCRDCKHHDGIRCFRWNSTIITGFDDFCSNAERRSEEE